MTDLSPDPKSVEGNITDKLQQALDPAHLEVINESVNHNVPEGSESHFKVIIVAAQFDTMRLVARHRLVNQILAVELAGPVHALALHTMTPDEYFERAGHVAGSPDCLGGEN